MPHCSDVGPSVGFSLAHCQGKLRSRSDGWLPLCSCQHHALQLPRLRALQLDSECSLDSRANWFGARSGLTCPPLQQPLPGALLPSHRPSSAAAVPKAAKGGVAAAMAAPEEQMAALSVADGGAAAKAKPAKEKKPKAEKPKQVGSHHPGVDHTVTCSDRRAGACCSPCRDLPLPPPPPCTAGGRVRGGRLLRCTLWPSHCWPRPAGAGGGQGRQEEGDQAGPDCQQGDRLWRLVLPGAASVCLPAGCLLPGPYPSACLAWPAPAAALLPFFNTMAQPIAAAAARTHGGLWPRHRCVAARAGASCGPCTDSGLPAPCGRQVVVESEMISYYDVSGECPRGSKQL